MSIRESVVTKAKEAQKAARELANVDTNLKNDALLAMADALEENMDEILKENQKDMEQGEAEGLSDALMDRLLLTEERIKKMANGLREVAQFDDPIGEVLGMKKRPNGLEVGKVRVPLGVIGMIYESRPNVTVDAAGLCLKAGNTILLRGGSEAINSNKVLTKIIAEAAYQTGIPEGAIQLVETTDRKAVQVIFELNEHLDVLIPRGGPGLIQAVIENSTVPVIETGIGNCHTYIDSEADLNMAREVVMNAKVQRPGVCNAMETLLVHREIAQDFLPEIVEKLQEAGVEVRGDETVQELNSDVNAATKEDWQEEYHDYILAIKVVDDYEAAVEHIHNYSTKHSEAIITEDYTKARKFLNVIDAAAVYVNASTRFTDGGEFGLGAEIGISTQKLHARGPMGINELTTTKFIIYGEGQIRE